VTRYVKKKHGLVIGSDNLFFFRGEDGVLRSDFRAIVWAKDLKFKQINTANFFIRSPAHQFIWCEQEAVEIEKLGEREWERAVSIYSPNRCVESWLNKNAAGWACPSPSANKKSPTLFFIKRSHALAFTRFVEEQLEGMDYL
jgi:hypothetical protein